jgi:hypothetical protein
MPFKSESDNKLQLVVLFHLNLFHAALSWGSFVYASVLSFCIYIIMALSICWFNVTESRNDSLNKDGQMKQNRLSYLYSCIQSCIHSVVNAATEFGEWFVGVMDECVKSTDTDIDEGSEIYKQTNVLQSNHSINDVVKEEIQMNGNVNFVTSTRNFGVASFSPHQNYNGELKNESQLIKSEGVNGHECIEMEVVSKQNDICAL